MTLRWCEGRPRDGGRCAAVSRNSQPGGDAPPVREYCRRSLAIPLQTLDGCWRDDLDTGVSGRSAIETCLQCAVIHDEAHRLRASIFMIELQKERRSTLLDANILDCTGGFRQGVPDTEPNQHPLAALGNCSGSAVLSSRTMRLHRYPVSHCNGQTSLVQSECRRDTGQPTADDQHVAENVFHALFSSHSSSSLDVFCRQVTTIFTYILTPQEQGSARDMREIILKCLK